MSEANFKSFFQKLSDNVGAALYERLSSPFFQSFVAAWIALNWEIIYYLISSDVELDALGRIEYVRQNLASTKQILWKPLAWSFGFLLAYILLSSIGFFIWEVFQQVKRFIRGRVIGWRPADEDDVKSLKLKIKELDNVNNDLINQFGTQRLELQNKLVEFQGEKTSVDLELNELKKLNEDLEDTLEKSSALLSRKEAELKKYQNDLSNNEANLNFKTKKLDEVQTELEYLKRENEKLKLQTEELFGQIDFKAKRSWDFLNLFGKIGDIIYSNELDHDLIDNYRIALAFSIDDVSKSPNEVFSVAAVNERSGLGLKRLIEFKAVFRQDEIVSFLKESELINKDQGYLFSEDTYRDIFKRKPIYIDEELLYTIAEIYFCLTNEAREKIDYPRFRSFLITRGIIKKKY